MRCLLVVLLAGLATLPLISADDQPSANVNITPRAKSVPGVRDDGAKDVLERRADLRVDTSLVQIPVVVTLASNGRLVTALEKENFKVLEDKVEQQIVSFSAEDVPMSVGIVFDTSSSMGVKLQRSREAVAEFLKTANPEDEFLLVQFSDRAQLTVPFTSHTEDVQSRLTFTQPKGSTALLDGVYLAMNQMKKAHNGRKAILIISDGGDNNSRFTESEVKDAVREADVQIYSIGIFEPIGGRGRTPEELSGPGLLGELSESTGGRNFSVENLANLPDIAMKIGLELRNQYVLGYRPKNDARDGKYRKVEVKLVPSATLKSNKLGQLRVQYREGYYAATQ